MLRAFVLLIAAALIVCGLILLVSSRTIWPAGAELLGIGVLFAVGVLFERHYRTRVDTNRGTWQKTGERFVDPTSGKLVEVRYNPQTGERDYREL